MAIDTVPERASPPTPERQTTPRAPRELVLLAALLLVAVFLFCYGLGSRAIWDIDEGKHAASSKLIIETGDWIVPYWRGHPFLDKPILHNWFVSLCFLLLGVTEFAARLPAALLGIGSVLLAYLLGKRMFGPLGGALGGVVLATSLLQVVLARTIVHDISLEFFVIAAMLAFHAAYRRPTPQLPQLLLFYAALGFAVLAKGLVGLLLPALPIALSIALDRRWRFIRQMRPLLGVLIVGAIAAPWYVAIETRVPGYSYYFFIERHFGGFMHGDLKGARPIWTYVPILLVGMLPWTALLPGALWLAWRDRQTRAGRDLVFLLSWFGAGFLFFSLSSAKLPTYILPLIPPLALLVGRLWQQLLEAPNAALRRAIQWFAWPLTAGLAIGAIGLWIWPATRLDEKYSIDPAAIAALASSLAIIAGLGLAAFRRAMYRWYYASHVAISVLLLVVFVDVLAPAIDPHRSSREMAIVIDRVLPPGEPITTISYGKDSVSFYTDRIEVVVPNGPDYQAFMRSPHRVYCLVDQDDIDQAMSSDVPAFVAAHYGDTYIVSNRKGELEVPPDVRRLMR